MMLILKKSQRADCIGCSKSPFGIAWCTHLSSYIFVKEEPFSGYDTKESAMKNNLIRPYGTILSDN